MSGPLVSIVVPVYNVESYIEECLQSVCSQTYENLEIICVDDVGNDRSMDVVRSFAVKDCGIKIIEHDKNKGLAEARNTGLEHVSGDYVFFLDSDDWLSIDAIEKLVRSAKVGEPDIVVGQGLAFSDDDTKNTRIVTESVNLWLALPKEVEVRAGNLLMMVSKIPCVAWGKLFRMEFLLSNKLKFITQNVRHEDNGFHLKCIACRPRVSVVNDFVYHYRIRASSIMGKIREMEKGRGKALSDYRKVIDDACEFASGKDVAFSVFIRDSAFDAYAFRRFGCVFYWGYYRKFIRIGPIVFLKLDVSSDRGTYYLKVFGVKVFEKPFVL